VTKETFQGITRTGDSTGDICSEISASKRTSEISVFYVYYGGFSSTNRINKGASRKLAMAIAISGATIISEYEGPYTNLVTYRRRCDACGYVPPGSPISVSIVSGSTVAYGTYHTQSFVCPFCENRQVVEIQG
jgi:hypothetical protein